MKYNYMKLLRHYNVTRASGLIQNKNLSCPKIIITDTGYDGLSSTQKSSYLHTYYTDGLVQDCSISIANAL